MKKKILLIFLIIFIFCGFKIDVFASDYAYCYYNYFPNDDDFIYPRAKCGFLWSRCAVKGGLALAIEYNSVNKPTPTIIGRVYDYEKDDFENTTNFVDTYNNIEVVYGFDCINSNNISVKMCMQNLPSVNPAQLKNNEGKLVCPVIYLYKDEYKQSKPTWTISLSSDNNSLYGEGHDKVFKIEANTKFSKTNTDDSEKKDPNVPKIATSCAYNYNYSATAYIHGSGTLGFSIMEDGTVKDIYSTGDTLSGENLVYKGNKITDLKCPQYLKFKSVMGFVNDGEFQISPTDNKDEADATYAGAISNADDNKTIIRYIYIKNSSRHIELRKNGDTYNAQYFNENITISNMNEYFNSSTTTYPTYLLHTVKDNKDVYEFTNNKDSNFEKKNVFILSSELSDLSSLKTSDIILNCEQLFGESFMKFLRQNVYIPFVIAIPIILIVLTTIDFAKVIFSGDKDGLKKAGSKFAKRAIMTVVILLVPTILIFVADLIGVDEVQQCAKAIKNYSESS